MLMHKVMTLLEDLKPEEVTNQFILNKFSDQYCLFSCIIYTTKNRSTISLIVLSNGSLDFTKKLVHHQALLCHITKRREYGVGNKCFGQICEEW